MAAAAMQPGGLRLGLLFEERVEAGARIGDGRCGFSAGRGARAEVFAEIRAMLIDHATGLGLAALVVVGGIVEVAIEAGVERAIALGTFVAKADALDHGNFAGAVKTVHTIRRFRIG